MVPWFRLSLLAVTLLVAGLRDAGADARPEGKRLGNATVRATPPSIELEVELYDANPDYLSRDLAAALYPNLFPNQAGAPSRAWEDRLREGRVGEGRLISTEKKRAGTVADGESRLLVAVTASLPGRVSFRLRPIPGVDVGRLESIEERPYTGDPSKVETSTISLWDSSAKSRAFALYVPPRAFDPAGTTTRETVKKHIRNTKSRPPVDETRLLSIEARNVEIEIVWRAAAHDGWVERTFPIALLRPPVVLVHGTYDSAKGAWDWPDDRERLDKYREHARNSGYHLYDTPNFARQLEARGFAVSLVNYEQSNGVTHPVGESVLEGAKIFFGGLVELVQGRPFSSHFSSNAKVVWDGGRMEPAHDIDRGEGIRQALDFFRDQINVAATKADVVGHSMGGVLARVYARGIPLSEPYDRPGDNWYRRTNNWNQGDINRLITIGSTHKGSHVPRLASQYWDNNRVPWLTRAGWQARTWFQVGDGAFSDQLPDSEALRSLGPTEVPTHTIAAVATRKDLDKFDVGPTDPNYRGRFGLTWEWTRPDNVATVFDNHGPASSADRSFPGLEDALDIKDMMARVREKKEELDSLEQRRRNLNVVQPIGAVPTPEMEDLERRIRSQHAQLMQSQEQVFLRYVAASFWNDYSDFTTSLDSALNGQDPGSKFVTVLPYNYRAACEGILHGYEPRHDAIQKRVIDLLTGGIDAFAPGLKPYQIAAYRSKDDPRRWTPWQPDDSKCQPPQFDLKGAADSRKEGRVR